MRGQVGPCGRLSFSSRRRHTSWPRDWSSDVCSSDLTEAARNLVHVAALAVDRGEANVSKLSAMCKLFATDTAMEVTTDEIGRASCREREESSVGAGAVNLTTMLRTQPQLSRRCARSS